MFKLKVMFAVLIFIIPITVWPFENIYNNHITLLGLTLGVDNLDNVLDKLGISEVTSVENCHHCKGVCYYHPTDADTIKILFFKNPIADLLGFKLSYLHGERIPNQCVLLRNGDEKIMTKSGLYLGMPKKQFLNICGKPDFIIDSIYVYQSKNKIKLPNMNELFDDVITVKATFNEGILTVLEITRTVTN